MIIITSCNIIPEFLKVNFIAKAFLFLGASIGFVIEGHKQVYIARTPTSGKYTRNSTNTNTNFHGPL